MIVGCIFLRQRVAIVSLRKGLYFEISAYETNIFGLTYKSIVLDAMSIWNTVGRIQWIGVSSESNADTIVSCVYNPDATFTGVYISHFSGNNVYSGALQLNTYYQYNFSYAKTLKTCIHELGHGIGLGHINYAGINNVMYRYAGEYTGTLGQGDLAAYRYLWG